MLVRDTRALLTPPHAPQARRLFRDGAFVFCPLRAATMSYSMRAHLNRGGWMNDHIAKLIDDLEYAAMEHAQAAVDATDAGHEYGDSSPAAHDTYKYYMNWRAIVADAANALRTALDIGERRPDVEAYISPTEGM